jgi:hypothetical protein
VEDGPYGAVIMELVDGEDLDRRVRRAGPLPPEDVARIGADVAAALSAAHGQGVLHRDVKPQNILLERGGRARLTDFGSARMDGESTITRTGAIIGTLAYMAPETIAGRRGDARADVFALGMTLFHAAAGRLPDRPSPHLPVPPSDSGYTPLGLGNDVPVWLAHVIARATSANPGDRYSTPTALGEALVSRDARAAAGLASMARDRCVLCGALDVFSAGVCPSCTSSGASADAFVFLTPPVMPNERERALYAAAELLGADVHAETLAAVTSGARPLMRVPAESESRVVEMLAARGLAARVIRERELWRALPAGFQLMAAAVVVTGIIGGSVGSPMLGMTAVPFALLLVVGGTLSLRRPAISVDRQRSALSDGTRSRIAETFAALPQGPSRSLLGDVVRRGQAVTRALAIRQDATGAAETVDDLLMASCASARDLAALDESLAQFDRERARDDGDARWLDSLTECERTRDAAVQRLLDAVTVLGQLDAQAIRGTEDASARLGELVAEIERDVRARSAASREITDILRR